MNTEKLAIYAAVISTFTFCWRVFEYFDSKRKKIKIFLVYDYIHGYNSSGELVDNQRVLTLTIVNISDKPVYLTYVEAVFTLNEHLEIIDTKDKIEVKPHDRFVHIIEGSTFDRFQEKILGHTVRILCWNLERRYYISKKIRGNRIGTSISPYRKEL